MVAAAHEERDLARGDELIAQARELRQADLWLVDAGDDAVVAKPAAHRLDVRRRQDDRLDAIRLPEAADI